MRKLKQKIAARRRALGMTAVVTLAYIGLVFAAPQPEIDVQGNGVSIPDGSTTPDLANHTDFGSTSLGGTIVRTFTILNTGAGDLTVGTVTVSDTTHFAVTAQPGSPVAKSASTTFDIEFSPQTAGTFSVTVNIPNDDSDESPYDFVIQGDGTGAPEIVVLGNGTAITDGDTTPDAGDDTEFGTTGIGTPVDHVFTIRNDGNADLTVGTVTVSGSADFSVSAQPSSPVAPSSATTFTIRFDPTSGGLKQATVDVPNNDSDENPYDFLVQGTGVVAAPTVTSPSVAAVEAVTATLGGDMTSNGGEDASERGIYWSATSGFSPPGQGAKVSQTPGPYIAEPFSVSVPGLDPGSLLYFKAFATNGAGTGFSAEQAFQTEPATQPTGIDFTGVGSDTMTIGWTPQSGDGHIVVVRQGGLPTADPVDFTLHNAIADPWNGGDDLGGGNYVVYRGPGSSVTINGLGSGLTYGVAIYAYAGSGGTDPDGINYQQEGPLTGTQDTQAGPPSLSNPTVLAFATSSSADLEATIDGNGGAAINSYGFVWSLSPNPTLADGSVEIGSSDPGTGPFSGTVPGLDAGKLIYFAGYATNANQTGYSPDGTFYTEPGASPTSPQFSSVGFNSFTLTWTAVGGDSYDGSIVVVKEGGAVDADPADGTVYVANPVFGGGTELGTGNYVVYSGSGNSVTITGLFHQRTYHVAIYAYSGTGAQINYRLTTPAPGSQQLSEASSHREAYSINCSKCHQHGGGGFGLFVPVGLDQENMCKTCHNPSGVAKAKADVANHNNHAVDCGTCHEVHGTSESLTSPRNILFTTDWRTGTTAKNQNWVRGNMIKHVPGASSIDNGDGTYTFPVIYHNGSAAELVRPESDTSDPGNTNPGYLDGVCQSCHTQSTTSYHTNNPTLNPPGDATNGYTHPANVSGGAAGQDCRDCHFHSGGFAPTVTETNCLASGCHDQVQGSRRRIVESSPGAGDGDFSTGMTSHHVNDGTGSQIVTRWDCIACHAEGDAVTGEITGYHITVNTVDLRNADGTVNSYTDENGVYVDWAGLTPEARDDFCLSCHDADGATLLSGRTDPDPDATTNPLDPFNDGVRNAHEADGFDGTVAPHARIRPSNQTGAGSPGVVDVKTQFDPTNAAHHAVLGPAYGTGSTPSTTAPGGSLATAVFGPGAGQTDITWESTLNCEDCHYGSAGTKLNGHGTVNSRYMLRDASGNDAVGIYDPPTKTLVCYRCHDPQTQPSNYDKHVGRDGDHMFDGNNIYGIACLNCHGGGYPESYLDRGTPTPFVSGAIAWGGIHGVPTAAPSVTGMVPNLFHYGSALGNTTNWTPLGTASCGAIEPTTVLNNCTNHSSRGASDAQNYTRIYDRSYRAP